MTPKKMSFISKVDNFEEVEESAMSVLELPDLVLECILERTRKDSSNLKQGKPKGLMRIQSKVDDSSKQCSLPGDSIMSWFLALETCRFWFPAQVYNREVPSAWNEGCDHRKQCAMGKAPSRRALPFDTSPHDLHISDCLNELRPGDNIEIQWRRNKEFPYGWWYGVVGHLNHVMGNKNCCRCHNSGRVHESYFLCNTWFTTCAVVLVPKGGSLSLARNFNQHVDNLYISRVFMANHTGRTQCLLWTLHRGVGVQSVHPGSRWRFVPFTSSSSSTTGNNLKLSAAPLKADWLDSLSCPPAEDPTPTNADSTWVIGIDPDLSGALALVKTDSSGCSAQIFDSPYLPVQVGNRVRKRLDARSIVHLVKSLEAPTGTVAYIEQSIPFPKDGKQGWWSGGFGYGLWIGILVASGFSVVPVSSLLWKKEFELTGAGSTKVEETLLLQFNYEFCLAVRVHKTRNHLNFQSDPLRHCDASQPEL
ncbi:Detected protein of unknown function [Hibiscus syriacus]|uniref:Uncharacterized protein n=1 Tax=Hibiscus syriacus TaxID=106335 RepID=A0A6A2WG59_HIBSY|nr:Detected protein of unknown function [Hibiscus syriacus]